MIPVRNGGQDLSDCLDAVAHSTLVEREVIVVDDGSTDDSASRAAGCCDKVVQLAHNLGPSAARNQGASFASAPLIFFLDADVLVEPETLERVVATLDAEPDAAGLFCSYAPDTPAPEFVSRYKNLLHHHTHQISQREAATFCGGYGALRTEVFREMGGFDESIRAMEDVEFGYRLHQAGHRILLCAEIHLRHMKRYTLWGLIRSDVFMRAIPWTRIMLERRIFRSDLNLKSNNIASTFVVAATIIATAATPWLPVAGPLTLLLLFTLLIVLNRDFLARVRQHEGIGFTAAVVPMIWLFHVYGAAGLALGTLAFTFDNRRQSNSSGSEEPA